MIRQLVREIGPFRFALYLLLTTFVVCVGTVAYLVALG